MQRDRTDNESHPVSTDVNSLSASPRDSAMATGDRRPGTQSTQSLEDTLRKIEDLPDQVPLEAKLKLLHAARAAISERRRVERRIATKYENIIQWLQSGQATTPSGADIGFLEGTFNAEVGR